MKEQYQQGKILLIDKPFGWSSFQTVNKIKHILKRKYNLPKSFKIGHAGTLDPLATGLLIIATGKFTKRISELQTMNKEYCATMRVGATTPSYDLETEIDKIYPFEHITKEQIQKIITHFIGEIEQKPPIFSAIKKDGKRLYQHARKGEEIEIASRKIVIYELEINKIELPEINFRVKCGKGTYIRSLAYDFGLALHSGAYLSALRRTKIGDFSVENAIKIEDFETEMTIL